jgi:MFS family permease
MSALHHHNFRLYFVVQVVSNVGTWVQITVENWLVLELSHSGFALGVTNALQFGPLVLLGMYGGVIADRHDRRRLLMLTQAFLALLALAVGLLAGIGILSVWMIWLAALGFGLIKCFDMPALQSFAKDLVGLDDLSNAVAWTNTISATGRMVGPVLGGLVLTNLGPASGFLIVVSTLQAQTVEDMRGRVMALYSICFLGVVSGPGFGGLAEWLGVSGALCVAASICAGVAVIGSVVWQATRQFGRAV